MQSNNLILAIAVVLCLFAGAFIGWHAKPCDSLISESIVRDTVWKDVPILEIKQTYKPKNNVVVAPPKIVLVPVPGKAIHDTEYIFSESPLYTFDLDDTLSHGGIKVAIHDKGGCFGITDRTHTFFGSTPSQVITNVIEKTIEASQNIFQLNAGAGASFINTKIDSVNRFKAFDVGPVVGVSYKQKYFATYQYGLNTNTHNFSLQTKIR